MTLRWSIGLAWAAAGLVGCGMVKGVAGDMGVPVKTGDRVGELAEQQNAKNRNLAQGAFVFDAGDGTPRPAFRLGEPIVGRLQASASAFEWYAKYTGDLDADKEGVVVPMLFVDGHKVYHGEKSLKAEDWNTTKALELVLWDGGDKQMPLTHFDVQGGHQWSDQSETVEERFYDEVADRLPAGEHEIRFEVHVYAGLQDNKPPFAAGAFTLIVDDAGRKALAAQSKRVPGPPQRSYAADDRAVKELANDLAKQADAELFLARTAGTWGVELDAFQQPIRRHLTANFVYKQGGGCRWRKEARLCQDHLGGGRYGDFYYCDDYKIFEGKPGYGLYAIPCGAAAKLK